MKKGNTSKSPPKYAAVDTNTLLNPDSMEWIKKEGYETCLARAVIEEIEFNHFLSKAIEKAKWEPKIIGEQFSEKMESLNPTINTEQSTQQTGFKAIAQNKKGEIIMEKIGRIEYQSMTSKMRKKIKVVIVKKGYKVIDGKPKKTIIIKLWNKNTNKEIFCNFMKKASSIYGKIIREEFQYIRISSRGSRLVYTIKARHDALNKKLKEKGLELTKPQTNDFRILAAAENFKKNNKESEIVLFSRDLHLLNLQMYKRELNLRIDIKNPENEKWKNKY